MRRVRLLSRFVAQRRNPKQFLRRFSVAKWSYTQKGLAGLFFLGGGGGGLTSLYYFYIIRDNKELSDEVEKIEEEPELSVVVPRPAIEFDHPFCSKPFWWRSLFTIWRYFFLVKTFLPLIWLGFKQWVKGDDSREARVVFLELMVKCFETAGATWIKMAQWLSMRPDMVPPDFTEACTKLLNQSPTHPWSHTKRIVERDLGKPIDEIFEEFSMIPVASGSIAQVYKAHVKKGTVIDGNEFQKDEVVAVKVRHEQVVADVFVDLKLIWSFMSVFMTQFGITMPFQHGELSYLLRRQIDLRWEGHNLQIFNTNFRDEENIIFPKVKFASEEVLIESWISRGRPAIDMVSNFGLHLFESNQMSDAQREQLAKQQLGETEDENTPSWSTAKSKQKACKVVFDMFIKMMMRDNFTHADLHAGNVWVESEEGKEPVITVLDCGLVSELEPCMQRRFGRFLASLASGNLEGTMSGISEFNIRDNIPNLERLRSRVEQILSKFVRLGGGLGPDGRPIQVSDMFGELLKACQVEEIVFRADIATTLVTMNITDGLLRGLYPGFDTVANAKPYIFQFSSTALSQKVVSSFYNFVEGGEVHPDFKLSEAEKKTRVGGANFFQL